MNPLWRGVIHGLIILGLIIAVAFTCMDAAHAECFRYTLPSGTPVVECAHSGDTFVPAPGGFARRASPPPEAPLEYVIPAFVLPPVSRNREAPTGPVPSLGISKR